MHRSFVVADAAVQTDPEDAGTLALEADTIQAEEAHMVQDIQIRPADLGILVAGHPVGRESVVVRTDCSAVVDMVGIAEVDGSRSALAAFVEDDHYEVGDGSQPIKGALVLALV